MTWPLLVRMNAGKSSKIYTHTLSNASPLCTPPRSMCTVDCFSDYSRHRHQNLNKTHVNKFALVYHWQGSDDSLKPTLLTAHQGLCQDVNASTCLDCLHDNYRCCACRTSDCRRVASPSLLRVLRR